MKITKVYVEYSELKSSGFNNKKFCVGYEAEIENPQTVDATKKVLMEKAMTEVKRLHGEISEDMVVKTYLVPEEEKPW